MLNLHAEMVSEGHLADSLGNSACLNSIRGNHPSDPDILLELFIRLHHLSVNRYIEAILFRAYHNDLVSGLLKLRRNHVLSVSHIDCKGHQGRRHVDLLAAFLVEGAGHAVLSADGRKAEAHLRAVCAEQSRKRLAPPLRILAHSAEIFLECKADLLKITAGSHDLRHRGQNRIDGSMVRAPAGKIRIEAVAHHGDGVRLSL